MDPERLRELLHQVQNGALSIDAALKRLRVLPFEDLGFAKVDHHRALRSGVPEVVFGAGKTAEQIIAIARRLADAGPNLLITRLSSEKAEEVCAALPGVRYHAAARLGLLGSPRPSGDVVGTVSVVTAGTADLPVAEEAAMTAEFMGSPVERIYDVGVAGIHRLFAHLEQIQRANVLVVVAGMEGALPSVVGGLVDRPVIAVPTSTGYGASFNGVAALLAMMNSCAAGVTVVNIDNGFGAGIAAGLMNRTGRTSGSDTPPTPPQGRG